MIHSFNFNDEKTLLKLYCLEGNNDGTKLAESETEDKETEVLLLRMNNVQKNQRIYHILVVSFTLTTK
jgi:hypothetical protein